MLRKIAVLAVATLVIGLGVLVGTGIATAANDHSLPTPNPETFTDINPCTGNLVNITETYTKAVFHESTDAQGGDHFTVTLVATLETDDGFVGRETFWIGANESGDSSSSVF